MRVARRRGGQGARRRPLLRSVLASLAGALLVSTVGTLALGTPAGAYEIGPQSGEDGSDGIGIQAFWFVQPDDHVTFKDIGGQCDRAKVSPNTTVRDLIPKSGLGFYLYTASVKGSCFFERSWAQYRVELSEPSGKTLWTDINVTENSWSSRSYRVDCYGDHATLPCHPDSRFEYHTTSEMGPLVWFGNPSTPSGYTWCSPQGFSCLNLRGTVSMAYGADGRFGYWTEHLSTERSGLVPCPLSWIGDPARGWYKSCFYKT